jgi:cytochrome d ubiquinol oxidase subunit I
MLMIDMVASYMLTPRPPGETWAKILNPSMPYLHVHRIVGNLTWTGFGLAALCAGGLLRSRTEEDGGFYRWAGSVCFAIGFGALLIMPAIGYQYLLRIRHVEPQAFYTLMLGPRSWLFDLVALLYSSLILFGSLYIWRNLRGIEDSGTARLVLPLSFGVVAAAGCIFSLPYHLQHVPGLAAVTDRVIFPLGKMQPNKYFAMAFLVFFGLLMWTYFLRSLSTGHARHAFSAGVRPDPWSPRLLFLLSFYAMLMMLTMGWSRETARAYNGYLIYGQMTLEEERATYRRPVRPSLSVPEDARVKQFPTP